MILGAANSILAFRTNGIIVDSLIANLLSHPIGTFMARVLPSTKFNIAGISFSLNPGPFSIKEHVLISVIANAGGT
jgi:hypothetical protein